MTASTALEFRTKRASVRPVLIGTAVVVSVAGVAAVVGVAMGSTGLAIAAGLVATMGLTIGAVAASTVGSVTVRDGQVERRRWPRRRVVLDIDGVRGLHGPFISGFQGLSRSSLLVLRGRGDGRRIVLADDIWSRAVLDELAALVGADTATGVMDARAWQRRARGLLPWWYRHPWLTVAGWVVAGMVLFVGGVVLAG